MSLRLTIFVALLSAVAACKSAPRGSDEGGPCATSVDCTAPLLCLDGVCAVDPARGCELDQTRCNGNAVQTCVDDPVLGKRWQQEADCDLGCFAGACRQTLCTPRAFSCETNGSGGSSVISRCSPDGTAWTFHQLCVTGCQVAEEGMIAACNEPSCEPFQTRCGDGGPKHLETCNAAGTAWVDAACEADGDGESFCVSGRCVDVVCEVERDEEGAIVGRQEQCDGSVARQCNDLGTGYEARELCAAGCEEVDGRAVCADVICGPSSTRCVDHERVESCNASGTAWTARSCSTLQGEGRCANGVCLPKACSVTRVDGEITARDTRCRGAARQQCNDSESDWTTVELCAFGCELEGDPALPVCSSPVCDAGERECQGDWLVACAGDRAGFDFLAYCASGCLPDTSASPASAACAQTACTPLHSRCGFDPDEGTHFVEVCVTEGTGYARVDDDCAQGCHEGACVSVQSECRATEVRCVGQEVQVCTQLDNNVTEWRFEERCLGGCSNGACLAGGACGCAQGDPMATCGLASRRPLSLTVLAPDDTTVPCDGESRLALTSSVITDAAGLPVPDGTLVTFSYESLTTEPNTDRPGADYLSFVPASPDPLVCRDACASDERCVAWTYRAPEGINGEPGCALKNAVSAAVSSDGRTSGTRVGGGAELLASVDADASVPGVQRPTLHGRAVVLVRAPDACVGEETVRVVGSLGGHCSGSGLVAFAEPQPTEPPGRVVWVAEDFSSRAHYDRLRTTAIWDTSLGLRALTPFDFGTGGDGLLEVAEKEILELDTARLATVHEVLSLGDRELMVAGAPPNLKARDEVLLVNVYGPASVRGRYEFKTVAEVDGQRVRFTEPVVHLYSSQPGGNLDLTGQRVVLQRVPHFTSVTVGREGKVTMSPMTQVDGVPMGGSGILAFRASEGVRTRGSLTMNGRGMAPGTTDPGRASGSASMDRLVVGESTGGTGGGAIYVHAPLVSFFVGGQQAGFRELIDASPSASGHGGSIWVATGKLELGSTCLPVGGQQLCRVTGGAESQVRIDYGTSDFAEDRLSRPAPFLGLRGPYLARSLTSFQQPAPPAGEAGLVVRFADLVGMLSGADSSEVIVPAQWLGGVPQAEPTLSLSVSADNGATFTTIESGAAQFFTSGEDRARTGRHFQWDATLMPSTERLPIVRALAFRLTLN